MAKQQGTAQRLAEQVESLTRLVAADDQAQGEARPLLDLYEVADAVIVEADVPGIGIEHIQVSVAHNQLVIESARPLRRDEAQRVCYLRLERNMAGFHRVVSVPTAIDPNGASARYDRGVLTIRLPKIQDRRRGTRKIPIVP